MKRFSSITQGIFRTVRNGPPHQFTRNMGTNDLVKTSIEDDTGIAILTMDRKPVNSIHLELMQAIHKSVADVENECKGIIITSSSKNVFSAGFDLGFLCGASREDMSAFWTALQQILVNMYGSSRPIVAAINGHAPAGGCAISVFADRRIMAEGKFAIGLNEAQFVDVMVDIIGRHETNRAVQLGYMFPASEALRVGLVDRLVPQEQVLEAAKEELKHWIKIPDEARVRAKKIVRQAYLKKFQTERAMDCESMVDYLLSEPIQSLMAAYLQSVKKQSKDARKNVKN